MASAMNENNVHGENEDEEDLEALRLAALMTLRKKPAVQPPPASAATFKPHFGNPNLIAIIPEGAEQPPRFYRHHPPPHAHPNPGRSGSYQQKRGGHTSASHSTLKVVPQVVNTQPGHAAKAEDESKEKEEVSTKFSRYDDTESESEDEIEKEEEKSDESSDESEDVLALQDEDDSLEALMNQMEHEIELGIDIEPNKKEKKKSKSSKQKGKEHKCKSAEKNPPSHEKQTKTAVIEPTVKDNTKSVVTSVKIHPIKVNNSENGITKPETAQPAAQSVVDSDIKELPTTNSSNKAPSPPPQAHSPKRELSGISRRSRSPEGVAGSRGRISPARPRSPRRFTPDRNSPFKKSPDQYYSRKKSPSPYYSSRDRGYSNRSRSPIRRKSLSPKRAVRDLSPRHYQRRSRSPASPYYRYNSPSHRYASSPWHSPTRRRSLSPKSRAQKSGHSSHSPYYRKSPKRRASPGSPRRSVSPVRKRECSPHRRWPSPKRDYNQRRNSPPLSPRRKQSPFSKKYSPNRSPRRIQRSSSPRRNVSPRRRVSPVPLKESRTKTEKRSRSPSLSLSPSSTRESKGISRRNKSPLRPRREVADVNNRTWRSRHAHSPDQSVNVEMKEKRKPTSKLWEKGRENRPWERRVEEGRRERPEKSERVEEGRRERPEKSDRVARKDKEKHEDGNLKITDNPLFEARRKKFESTALVEPTSKKIRLMNKKSNPELEKDSVEVKQASPVETKVIAETSAPTEEEAFSGQEEVDEIDNFLNEDQEDVLDLSAEVWDSDEDLLPQASKIVTRKLVHKKAKSPKKHLSAARSSPKEKRESRKVAAVEPSKPAARSRSPSPEQKIDPVCADRDDCDLRAELSRRREERLTKAGLLHEKVPRRLLKDAFENALGKKKIKKEAKVKKSKKESKKIDSSPKKEKSDGRRVLVLKRPAPVKMQSAHINVTFPSRGAESDSESSYSSSSSEDGRYTAAAQHKLPVYMRLGNAAGRKVKLGSRSRRSQV